MQKYTFVLILRRIIYAFLTAYFGIGLGSIFFGLSNMTNFKEAVNIDPIILINQFNPLVFLLIMYNATSYPLNSYPSIYLPFLFSLSFLIIWVLKVTWPKWTFLIIAIMFACFGFSVMRLTEPIRGL